MLSFCAGGLFIVGFFLMLYGKGISGMGSLVHKAKSPDNKHTLYYYKVETSVPMDTFVYCRRTGLFTYERQLLLYDDDGSRIKWENDGAYYLQYKMEYSSFGD